MELPILTNFGAQKDFSSTPNGLVKLQPSPLNTISNSHAHSQGIRHSHDNHSHDDEDLEDDVDVIKPVDVYFLKKENDVVPKEFDAVRINLDGRLMADLSWTKELLVAKEYIKNNKKIFWNLDLGLFGDLKYPLDHKAQYLSLCLSLEHFKNTIWKEFRQHTQGVCLYSGDIDFSKDYKWSDNQEANLKEWLLDHGFSDIEIENHQTLLTDNHYLLKLFCRDSSSEYLNLLCENLPDTIPAYVLLKTSLVNDPYEVLELGSKEQFLNFHVAFNGSPHVFTNFSWDEAGIKVHSQEDVKLGVCLSFSKILKSHFKTDLKSVIRNLTSEKKVFRLIPEMTLTSEWDGLDDLIVDSSLVDKQLFRKLQGFAAAGGKVIDRFFDVFN